VKPIGDRVFVKVDKARPRSVGGVLLPAVEQTSSTGGTVVEVGDVSMVKVGWRRNLCWVGMLVSSFYNKVCASRYIGAC